jgi:hypothetical protein
MLKKRIIPGVLLACIIVPTFFWAFDLIKVSVNPNSIASTIYDSAYAAKKTILDMAAEHSRNSVDDEYAQIAVDIEEIEEMLNGSDGDGPTLNSEQLVALRSELGDLLKRRESILDATTEQLLAIDRDRLVAEKYFLVKFRSKAVKEEWKSLSRIARIENTIGKHSSRFQQEKAAAVVNKFIDAVVEMNVDQVKELSATGLQKELGLARIRSMRRNTPPELESGFELRDAGKMRLQVWAGGEKVATLCSQHDGSWVFEEAWE